MTLIVFCFLKIIVSNRFPFYSFLRQLAQCCYHADGSRKPTAVFAMRDLAPHQSNQNHFYSTQQDKKEDAHVNIGYTFLSSCSVSN